MFFVAAVLEGPITTILAGFLLSQGYFDVVIVYAILALGDLVGDTLYYAIGRWGRQQFVNRWGKYIGITPQRLSLLEEHFKKHSGKTLLIGKISQGIGGGILVAAGAAQMPYGNFLLFNILGTMPKTLLLLVVGFFFGKAYVELNNYLNYTALGLIILSILTILFYTVIMKKVRRRISDATDLDI